MRITRLELFGFKSFPDRTSFEFGPGVSCVVGPNGSGKSNVVDAMRWCIGEQSARTLRGAEMLDVIFAGSADRTPVGFAEVRMTFASDTGEPFPGAYARMAELQVGRRLHRDGTSEYSINAVKCRRRDVLDLFLDTGIGSDLYSFIAQGQVERIVHATPMDRRAIFDEVAGISRYTVRRLEAQQRLEATAAQLDRAADVADEMTRRLDSLKRQVVKAAEFRRLRALIRQEEIALALVRYRELAADRKVLHERLRASELEAASARRELARRQQDLVQRREEIAVIDAASSKWRDEVAEHDARTRELEGARSHQEQRARDLVAQANRHREAAAAVVAEVEVDQGRVQVSVERISLLEQQLQAALDAEVERAAELIAARAATEVARTAWAASDRTHRDAAVRLATAEERLAGLEREVAGIDHRITIAVGPSLREPGAAVSLDDAVFAAEADVDLAVQALQAAKDARTAADLVAERAEALAEIAEVARDEAERELQRGRAALDAMVEQVAQEADGVRRQAEQELARTVTTLETARTQARERAATVVAAHEAEAASRRARLGSIRADRQRIEAEIASSEGELSRLRIERDALSADARAIHGLRDPTPLADRWSLDARGLDAWLDRVGDRVLLPSVAELGEVVAIAAALQDGAEARFVLGTERGSLWQATWTPTSDVASAVAHHLETGGASYSEGIRIDSDGVVVVGRAGGVAERVARRENLDRRLDDLRGQLPGSRAALAETEDGLAALVGEGRPVGEPVQWAADRLAEQERQQAERARAALREELAVIGLQGDHAVQEARDALARAIAAVAGARDRARAEGLARLELARSTVKDATSAAQRARSEAVAARQRALAAAAQVSDCQAVHARVEGTRTGAIARRDEALRVAAAAAQAAIELRSQRDRLAEAQVNVRRDVEAASTGATEAERALRASEADLAACRDAEASLLEREAEARAADATLRERLNADRESLDHARLRITEGQRRAEREVVSAAENDAAATDAASLAAAAGVEAGLASEDRARAWDRLNRERGRATRLREVLSETEREGESLRLRTEGLSARVVDLDAHVNRVRVDLEVLRRSMDERYQVGLAGLLDRLSVGPIRLDVAPEAREGLGIAGHEIAGVEDLEIKSSTLEDPEAVAGLVERNRVNREAVAKLGEVHLGALDEYADLATRHGALIAQREDLEASVTDIRHAIAKMNKTCRQRFRDAYDRVNEAFQEVYPRLVGGGTARLSLTDEEDVLQSGVEIFVQPPGKRLQNLTLLSGGEKAMTAIALVIAILKVRPSPFCVLDEVDAPLDEANGARFNDILREMSAVSQFVVITHNRKTMECADTLYGVTMGRPGVSTLVSVNLAG